MNSTTESKVRKAWIEASGFHPLDQDQVLREVTNRVGVIHHIRPVVIFDLDSTLYRVGARTFQILKEWCESNHSKAHTELREVLRFLKIGHVGYSLRDTFAALNVELDKKSFHDAWKAAKDFWGPRFFSGDYLHHDEPVAGAASYVQRLHAQGAEIVYLTGRDEPGMGEGTRKVLRRDGFPIDVPRTRTLLKLHRNIDDREHKTEAIRSLKKLGRLIASFENEPRNLVALFDLAPEAMHIFVETDCSDHPALPRYGLYRIKDFIERSDFD